MISISLATLAMQFAGEAKRNAAKMKAREASTRFLTISVPKARYLFHLQRQVKAIEELSISLQHISIDGIGILYQVVKLNVWYHISFSVLYSSNIVCITPRFDAILSEKSGIGFSRFYFRDIRDL